MTTNLKNLANFPLTQPYSITPWNYGGTEQVVALPNPNIVDWVLIELRNAPNVSAATASTVIATRAAFLLNNGSVVDINGSSLLHFTNPVSSQLFVVVYHRNHIPVISENALVKAGGIYSYDYTTSMGQVHGGALGHKQLAAGIWGMFAGNADGSNMIDISDKTFWINEAAEMQDYYKSDFNLDTQVDNKDKDDFWVPNQGKGSQVP